MTREHNYSDGDVLHAAMIDIVQEMLSSYSSGVTLEQNSSTSVKVASGSGSAQAALSINGKLRFVSTTETLTISGAADTYDIYAVVDTESPGATGSDPASRGFSLEQNNGTPTATSRKVGEVDWDGSAITAVRSTINAVNAAQIQPGTVTYEMLDSEAVRPVVVSFTDNATLAQMSNQFVEVDIASAKTATLPASPVDGDIITFSDVTGDLSRTRILTIARNGKLIDGVAANYLITTARTTICFRYNGTEWNVVYRTPMVDVQVFDSGGAATWTKPSGALWVDILVVGPGGSGGAGGTHTTFGGVGGGGGGGGAGAVATASLPASALAATVTATPGSGGGGGTSSFGSLLSAAAGANGTSGSGGGGSPAGGAGAAGGAAGSLGFVTAGTAGTSGNAGNSTGPAGNAGRGGNGGTAIGATGYSVGGTGALAAAASDNTGNSGTFGGGGGGGGGSDPDGGPNSGGSGGNGVVVVTSHF